MTTEEVLKMYWPIMKKLLRELSADGLKQVSVMFFELGREARVLRKKEIAHLKKVNTKFRMSK